MAQEDLPSELDNRHLFEFAPVVIWKADATALQAWYDDLRADGVTCLRSLLESDPQQVLHGLALVKIRRVNRAAVALFEAHDERHLLENTGMVLATVPLAVLIEVLVARWENRLLLSAEARMCTLRGKQIHGLVGISVPVECGWPDLGQIIITFTNITDRKLTEEALRESEERLRIVMKAAGTGWWDWDLPCNVLQLDEQCKTLLGVPPDMEVTFESFRERLRPESRPRIDETVLAMLRTPGDYEVECSAQWPDGTVHWGLLRGRSFHTSLGEPIRLMGTATDITAGRQSEEALRESEAFYRTLIETLPVTVVLADPQGIITYISPAAKEMFGLEPGEGLGTTPTDWIALEYHEVVRQRMHDVLVELRPQAPMEYRMFRRDGSAIWAQLASVPILDAQGRLKSVITVCQDITQRKQAEAALREREELLRLVLEASTTGWWHWDLATGQVTADAQAKALVGLPPEVEPSFEVFLQALTPEEISRVLAELPEALASPNDFDSEFHLVWADGSHHWVQARGRALRDDTGQAVRALGVMMDITERKRAEEELKRLNETLEQQVVERTTVAERRANQLRVLASELAQAEQRERRRLAKILHDHLQQLLYAAKLKSSMLHRTVHGEDARRLLQQTIELLDESLAESRSLAMALSPPVLYDRGLVGALEWLAREVRQKHDLRVHLELDLEAEPRDEGMRVFLFEAIRELLLNVVKHARASEARIELAPWGEEHVRVVVSDTGRGFDPAETDARGTASGFGLLSIRERLELLGGRMEIDSKPGTGTRVILEVPRGPSVTPAERAREVVAAVSSVALGTGQASVPSSPSHKEVRVVVADDHRVLREGLITVLHEQPEIEVVGEAADGQQALDLALCMQPDVVLMDVTMPGMDGIEATRRIKEALPQVRVIGLSMHNQADMAAAMRKAGATDYLSKEAASDALVAAVLARAVPEA